MKWAQLNQLRYLVVHNQNIKQATGFRACIRAWILLDGQVFDIYVDTFETVSEFPNIITERDEVH